MTEPTATAAGAPRQASNAGESVDQLDLPGTARVEAFSDGVFAIAATLLVLELSVPTIESIRAAGGLWPALGHEWPSYVGYIISFSVIGIMWANHHNIFKYIARSDHVLRVLNLLLMMFVAFIPFPTAVLAAYLSRPHERVIATAFYCGTFTVTAVIYNALWRHAAHHGALLHPHADPEVVQGITKRFLVGPVLYFIATVVAFMSTAASLAIIAFLALLYVLPEPSRRRVGA